MHSADTGGFSRKRQARAADAQADGRPRALARINPESGHGAVRRPEPSYTVIRPQLDEDDGDRTMLRPRELLAPIAAAMEAKAKARTTPPRTAPASARPMPPPIPTQAPMAPQAPAMSDFARVRATTARGPALGLASASVRAAVPPIERRREAGPRSKKRSAFIAVAVCIIGASLGVAGAAALNEQLTGPSAGEMPVAHRAEPVAMIPAVAAPNAAPNAAPTTPSIAAATPPAAPPAIAAAHPASAATSCAPGAVATASDRMAMMAEPPPPEAAHVGSGSASAVPSASASTHRTKEQREAAREARDAREAARASTARIDAPSPSQGARKGGEGASEEMAAAADALAKAQLEAALR